MFDIFYSLGIFDNNNSFGLSNKDQYSIDEGGIYYHDEDGNFYLNYSQVSPFLSDIDESGVLVPIKKYLEMGDWNSSGMEETFGEQLRVANNNDKEFEIFRQIGYTKDGDNAELIFLERYYHLGVVKRGKQDDFTESSCNYMDTLSDEELDEISDSSGFFKEDGTDEFRLEIGDIDSARKYILNYINNQDIFTTFEDVSANVEECSKRQQDLMVMGDAIYNLKQSQRCIS